MTASIFIAMLALIFSATNFVFRLNTGHNLWNADESTQVAMGFMGYPLMVMAAGLLTWIII